MDLNCVENPQRPRARHLSGLQAALVIGLAVLALGLLAGCLAEDGEPAGTGGNSGTPATWDDAATAFQDESCVSSSCHASGSGNPPSYDDCTTLVSVASSLTPGSNYVEPGDSAASVVYQVAAGTGGNPPFPMSFGVTSNLDTLKSWIDNGATCP